MTKMISNDIKITIKTNSFKRYSICFMGMALSVIGVIWVLQNALPTSFQEVLAYLGKDGELDLGFVSIGNYDDIKNLGFDTLMETVFSNNIILMLLSFFSIENFKRSLTNGYFEYLISKRVSRAAIYLAKTASSFIAALMLFAEYVLCAVVAGLLVLCSGSIGSINILSSVGILFKFVLGVLAFASLYTMFMSCFRNSMSVIISSIFMILGMPVFVDFLSTLTGKSFWEYLWIGDCINNLHFSTLYGSLSAMVYTFLSLVIGMLAFMKQDLA